MNHGLISFRSAGKNRYGMLRADGGIVDLTALWPPSLSGAIATVGIDALVSGALGRPNDFMIEGVELLPVIPDPEKIICVGANFPIAANKFGKKPAFPTLFARFRNTLVAHGEALQIPASSATLDFEGELAVIVGTGGRHIPRETAMAHIAGFSCFNDATVREWQSHSHQFTPSKNFPATAALGPVLVPCSEIADYRDLRITTRLNGQVVQDAQMDSMVFDIGEIIAYCSAFTPLRSGDIIACGSPDGFGATRNPPLYLQPEDVVEIEIPGIGCLRNTIALETPHSSEQQPNRLLSQRCRTD